jgi:copper(I)-binding protein
VTAPGWPTELARAAAGPVICAMVLTGLLSAWVASSGAGTLAHVQVKISDAAVPMRGFSRQTETGPAHTYLTIQDLGAADELVAVRSPVAPHVVLTRRDGPAARPVVVSGLPLPAGGTLVLTPLTDDVILEDPARFEGSADVPLTLVFRHAGTITIEAPVTAPGTP